MYIYIHVHTYMCTCTQIDHAFPQIDRQNAKSDFARADMAQENIHIYIHT